MKALDEAELKVIPLRDRTKYKLSIELTAEFIQFTDDDDKLPEDHIKRALKSLLHSKIYNREFIRDVRALCSEAAKGGAFNRYQTDIIDRIRRVEKVLRRP